MKTNFKLILLGLAAFVFFLAATAPASLITSQIEKHSAVRFTAVSGSLWHGTAQQLITPEFSAGPLEWQLHALPLLLGKLSTTLNIGKNVNNAPIQGYAKASINLFSTVVVQQANLNVAAEEAVALAGLPIAATGMITLDIDELVVKRKQAPRVKALLQWQNASVSSPQEYNLGAYTVTLNHTPSDKPEEVLGIIKDVDSPLTLDGEIRIQPSGRYKLNVNVNTDETAPDDIKRVLPFIGRQASDGSVTINRSGSINNLL